MTGDGSPLIEASHQSPEASRQKPETRSQPPEPK